MTQGQELQEERCQLTCSRGITASFSAKMNNVGFFKLCTSSESLTMPGRWGQTRGVGFPNMGLRNLCGSGLIFQSKICALRVQFTFFLVIPQKWPGL